jgi:hypothetical protein
MTGATPNIKDGVPTAESGFQKFGKSFTALHFRQVPYGSTIEDLGILFVSFFTPAAAFLPSSSRLGGIVSLHILPLIPSQIP